MDLIRERNRSFSHVAHVNVRVPAAYLSHVSKLPFVSRVESIRSKLSIFLLI